MAKISNRFLALQFLTVALSMQFFVAAIRSLIVGRDFFLILLPLLFALIFGPIVAHLCFKLLKQRLDSEMVFTLSSIILAINSALLMIPERTLGAENNFIIFRTTLFLCFFSVAFLLYSAFVSIDKLQSILEEEDYFDLVRVTYAGFFIGIIYNLVMRTALLAVNLYVTITLSVILSALAIYRYSLKIQNTIDRETVVPKENTENMKIMPHLIAFICVYVIFMLPLNNPELFSYMAGLNHELTQYIFVITSIIGVLFGGKVIFMKFLKPRVYSILLSYMPLLTFISIGLFGFYLFYPPNHSFYVVNYVIAILILSISAAISFFEVLSIPHPRKSAFIVLMLFLMQFLHNGIRLLMIERHMPYIWTMLLIIVGICQFISYKQQIKNDPVAKRDERIEELEKDLNSENVESKEVEKIE